jgi:uncharacterized YccA/Bax inhibitor family protein
VSKQMLNEQTFTAANIERIGASGDRTMSVNGVIARTLVLFAVTVVFGVIGWTRAEGVLTASPLLVIGGFAALVGLSIAAARNPRLAAPAGFAYAVIMGVWAGAISRVYNEQYSGIVLQAVLATASVFLAMLFLYVTRIVRVTKKMASIIMAATMGIALLYIISLVLSLFGAQPSFLTDSSPLGILLSIGICIVASLNLLLDFSFIEQGVAAGAPAAYEWYGAFALLSTLVWLYLEILRLLARLQSR